MKWTSDTLIGVGLVAALILTVIMPALGSPADYGKLQDTIAIGLVGFIGKAALPSKIEKDETEDRK